MWFFMEAGQRTFNRTYLELKQLQRLLKRDGQGAFNRTYLELKPKPVAGTESTEIPFNRTYLELKLVDEKGNVINNQLLIAPIWN